MNRFISTLAALTLLSFAVHADDKISTLPSGTTLAGTEAIPAVQSAVTVKTTPAAIKTFVLSTTLPVANGGTGAVTLTGPLKGNGTAAFTVAASADIRGLWTGTCNSTTFLRGDGACNTPVAGPAGSDTQIQYNNAGVMAGSPGLLWDQSLMVLSLGTSTTNGILQAGAPATVSSNGIPVTLRGGPGGSTAGGGGDLQLRGGIATTSGFGGGVSVVAANATGTSVGGNITITSGNSLAGNTGAQIAVTAGNGGPTGNGGPVVIAAGNGGATSGPGGTTMITGGNGSGGNANGGNLTLAGGLQQGSGVPGLVRIANLTSVGAVSATPSGCTLSANVQGPNAGHFTSGTTGTCTVTITFPYTAPNGFSCHADDITTNTAMPQTASTTTSCTVAGATTATNRVQWFGIAY